MKYATLLPSNKKIPINNIFCIGKNYDDHAKEMGDAVPSSPIVFLKPTSAVIHNGESIIIPKISNNVHHEVEFTILIGKSGKHIPQTEAYNYIIGYGVGLDMTLRDKQSEAKKSGLPWTVSKGFDTSAALSPFVEKSSVKNPQDLEIILRVNNSIKQHGFTSQMIYKIDFLISYLSSIFTLNEGDIIYTGTPSGVGPVVAGDILDAEIIGVGKIQHSVKNE